MPTLQRPSAVAPAVSLTQSSRGRSVLSLIFSPFTRENLSSLGPQRNKPFSEQETALRVRGPRAHAQGLNSPPSTLHARKPDSKCATVLPCCHPLPAQMGQLSSQLVLVILCFLSSMPHPPLPLGPASPDQNCCLTLVRGQEKGWGSPATCLLLWATLLAGAASLPFSTPSLIGSQ